MKSIRRFSDLHTAVVFHKESVNPVEEFQALISDLVAAGYRLGAGFVAYTANGLLWAANAEQYFEALALRCLEEASQQGTPFERLVSCILKARIYGEWRFRADPRIVAARVENELRAARTLVEMFSSDDHAEDYLAKGFFIETDLEAVWRASFSDEEVGHGSMGWGPAGAHFSVSSAFSYLVGNSQYKLASEVADKVPRAFKHPGICGWREVCRAVREPEKASEHFRAAAEYFASDVLPEDRARAPRRGGWTGLNSQALAPYFRARAVLSGNNVTPEEQLAAIRAACKLIKPERSGWLHGPSRKLAILVHGLGNFLESKDEAEIDLLIAQYDRELRLYGAAEPEDEQVLKGLSLVAESLKGFKEDALKEMKTGRIVRGIEILSTLPDMSQFQFMSALTDKLVEPAVTASQGTTSTEVITLLSSIEDERILQRLILQLIQAESPLHAKITHGPIEYGRDIVAVIDEGSGNELRSYAVKVGDIDAKKWPSLKESIDQLFTVHHVNAAVQALKPSASRCFMVFNGHIGEFVEPVIVGWLREVRKVRGWSIEVMDLDVLSQWIIRRRHVGLLKAFLARLAAEREQKR